jgi:hypothetical protein
MGKLTVIKRIEGYPGYLVTSDGRVLSTKGGKVKELNLKLAGPAKNKRFYVVLSKNSIGKQFAVHRLVATAFHGPCPDGMECCHNDGDRLNNHRDNLRWDTRKGNFADKKLHGTSNEGSKHGLSKLTEYQVQQIRATYSVGETTQAALAGYYGVSVMAINNIINRKTWTHI